VAIGQAAVGGIWAGCASGTVFGVAEDEKDFFVDSWLIFSSHLLYFNIKINKLGKSYRCAQAHSEREV